MNREGHNAGWVESTLSLRSKHCSCADRREKPSCAQQYVVLRDLGVHKSNISKLRMMTKENI